MNVIPTDPVSVIWFVVYLNEFSSHNCARN